MQATGRQPCAGQRAPDGAAVHYERQRPEQTTLYRLVQQRAATFFEQAQAEAGADLPQFVKDEFDAFLECGILAHVARDCAAATAGTTSWSPSLASAAAFARRAEPGAWRRRRHTWSTRPWRRRQDVRQAQTVHWTVYVRAQLLLAAQPGLVTPVLQVMHRVIARHPLGQAGLKADEADGGAVTLIQRLGSAANLNTHLHCLVLDGVYRSGTDGASEFCQQ